MSAKMTGKRQPAPPPDPVPKEMLAEVLTLRGQKRAKFLEQLRELAGHDEEIFADVEAVCAEQAAGRPIAINVLVAARLRTAFMLDCTVAEACLFAGVNKSTFDRYRSEHPPFDDAVDRWRQNNVLQARGNLVRVLGDKTHPRHVEVSLLYLRAKRPEEFGDGMRQPPYVPPAPAGGGEAPAKDATLALEAQNRITKYEPHEQTREGVAGAPAPAPEI